MKVRVITALAGVLAILLLVWLGSWAFTMACLAIGVLAYREYSHMLLGMNIKTYDTLSYISIAVMVLTAGLYSIPLFYAAVCMTFISSFLVTLRSKYEEIHAIFYTILGNLYIGIGVGSLVLLRGECQLIHTNEVDINAGIFLIMFAFLSTWASDTFAFFAGKRWGKRKLASHISPNKTIEGLIGGVVGSIILSSLYSWFVGYSLVHGIVLGAILSIASPIGDLFESYVKRVCGIKDSGALLPGHGGVLDRFDSLFFVAPTMVVYLLLISSM